MSGRQVRTVSLSRELDQFVTAQVASGQYSSASEVVRAGLRVLVAQQIKHLGSAADRALQ